VQGAVRVIAGDLFPRSLGKIEVIIFLQQVEAQVHCAFSCFGQETPSLFREVTLFSLESGVHFHPESIADCVLLDLPA